MPNRLRFLLTPAQLKWSAEATFTHMCIRADSTASATVSVVAVVTRHPPTLPVTGFFVPATDQALTCHTCACSVTGRVVRDRNLYTTTGRVARRRGAWIIVLGADERRARHAVSRTIT